MSTARLTGQKRLGVVLVLASAALTAVLVSEWQQGIALRDSVLALKSRPAASTPVLKLEPPFQLRDSASYARITEQPLFVASRTPSKQAAAATAAPPEQFELTGIAQTPKEAVVLLRNVKTGKTERLKTGEKAGDGLQLESVKPDGATIKQNGQNVALDLRVVLSGGRLATANASVAGPSAGQTPPAVASSTSATTQVAQPHGGSAAVKPNASPQKSAVDPGVVQLNEQRAKQGLPPIP